ncbi:MAG: ABC transporter permease [Candidatus Nanopelagicales bacterium]
MSDIQLEVDSSPVAEAKSRTLMSDAWADLRSNKIFWISAVLLVLVMLMVLFPGLIADSAKTSSLTGGCNLSNSLTPPGDEFRMGTDQQGCDVYALSVYGARPSVAVGVLAAIGTTLIGAILGLVAGFYGGKTDSILSRIFDIFLGVPYIIGAIVLLSAVKLPGIWGVTMALTLLSWPVAARMVRGKTIEAKNQDYTLAARALGATNGRIMLRHILPNAVGPSIVVAVISLGLFIGAEATLSYLGLGIQPPDFSWGTMIAAAQNTFFQAPWTLFVPAGMLTIAVLAFVLLGEAVSEALDPKLRK